MSAKRTAEPTTTAPKNRARAPKAAVPAAPAPGERQAQRRSPSRAQTAPATAPTTDTAPALVQPEPAQAAPSARLQALIVYRTPGTPAENDGAVSDIYALPNYERDGRTDRDSRTWAGQVQNTPDWLIQLSALYGSGYYIRVPRLPNGKFGKEMFVFAPPLPELRQAESKNIVEADDAEPFDFETEDDAEEFAEIERQNLQLRLELARLKERERLRAEMPARLPAPTAQPTLNDQLEWLLKLDRLRSQQPQPQSLPPKSMLDQLREVEEVRALLAPKIEAQPNPTPLAGDSLASVIVSLFNNAKTEDDREGALTAVQRLLGVEVEPQRSVWEELLLKLAESEALAQAIAPLVGAVAQFSVGQMAKAQSEPTSGRPRAATSRTIPAAQTAAATATSAAQSEPQGQQLTPQEALEVVINEWRANRPIERAAGIVQQLLSHPAYGPMLQTVLIAEPAETIAQLSAAYPDLATLPHAQAWLGKLVEAFTAEDAEDTSSEAVAGADATGLPSAAAAQTNVAAAS